MSTQKRENRSTPATKTCLRGPRNRWHRVGCTERAGAARGISPAAIVRYICSVASGQTALLVSILWSAWIPSDTDPSPEILERLEAKFLLSDYHFGQLVRSAFKAELRGSPPLRVHGRGALGTKASLRSSLRHIPYPSGVTGLHRTLPQGPLGPQAPAGYRRRAERYDGKRDMYLQHTA